MDERTVRIARELGRTLAEAAYVDIFVNDPNVNPASPPLPHITVAWWDAEEGVFVHARLTVTEP